MPVLFDAFNSKMNQIKTVIITNLLKTIFHGNSCHTVTSLIYLDLLLSATGAYTLVSYRKISCFFKEIF
jgi:hypothetical protein